VSQRGRRERSPLEFPNPIDVIVDGITWQLRRAGRRIITGVVLIAGLLVMSAALFVPLLLASLLIAVFGLTVEPYKWLGSVLIVVAFVVGVVAAPLSLLRVIRRGRRVIALTEFGDDDAADPYAAAPSPIIPAGPTREKWTAGIRALDERLAPPPDPPGPPTAPGADAG
jgi:hypothetical protein